MSSVFPGKAATPVFPWSDYVILPWPVGISNIIGWGHWPAAMSAQWSNEGLHRPLSSGLLVHADCESTKKVRQTTRCSTQSPSSTWVMVLWRIMCLAQANLRRLRLGGSLWIFWVLHCSHSCQYLFRCWFFEDRQWKTAMKDSGSSLTLMRISFVEIVWVSAVALTLTFLNPRLLLTMQIPWNFLQTNCVHFKIISKPRGLDSRAAAAPAAKPAPRSCSKSQTRARSSASIPPTADSDRCFCCHWSYCFCFVHFGTTHGLSWSSVGHHRKVTCNLVLPNALLPPVIGVKMTTARLFQQRFANCGGNLSPRQKMQQNSSQRTKVYPQRMPPRTSRQRRKWSVHTVPQ